MLGEELLDVIHRYPDHVWVFLHEFPALTGERAAQFRIGDAQYERRVEASCGPASTPASSATLDPWLTAMAWLGMHNYTYLWLKPGGRLSARDVAKPFADIFMRGIANPTPGAAGYPLTGAEYPPSTTRADPVVQREASPAR